MNVAYKHLQSKFRWRELTFGQWAGVAVGAVIAGVWGLYLSPLPPYLTLFSAVYVGGIPVMAVVVAAQVDFDIWRHVRWAIAWRRAGAGDAFAAGAGDAVRGYVVLPTPTDPHGGRLSPALDLEGLWD